MEIVINRATIRLRLFGYGVTIYMPNVAYKGKALTYFTYPAKTRRQVEERDRQAATRAEFARQAVEASMARVKGA